MRKILIFLSAFFLITIIFSSCSNTKTYAERLDEEKTDIAKMIADSFNVIDFNKDSLYTKVNKHIMKLSDNLYVAILDTGNRKKMAIAGTTVTFRFNGVHVLNDTVKMSNMQYPYPCQFVYQKTSTTYFLYGSNIVSCEGVQKPLEFLGDGARVKLIIPSKINFSDYADINVVRPLYFEELIYTFSKQ
jgi:hypothetical protein